MCVVGLDCLDRGAGRAGGGGARPRRHCGAGVGLGLRGYGGIGGPTKNRKTDAVRKAADRRRGDNVALACMHVQEWITFKTIIIVCIRQVKSNDDPYLLSEAAGFVSIAQSWEWSQL